jgi:hypothetical protein
MKAGTLIFLIVVILIAFGFVLSDSLDTHREVQELMNKINELNAQLGQERTQLEVCREQGTKDAQMIRDMQTKVEELEAEKKDLSDELAKLNAEKAVYEAQGSLLDLLKDNPILLIGALMTQIATSTLRYGKKLGIQWPVTTASCESNEYVRLSKQEREWLISTRRNRKNK